VRYDSAQKAEKPKPVAPSPFPSLTGTNLLAPSKIKLSMEVWPKMPQVEHMYSLLYYQEKIKLLVTEHWACDKGTLTAKGKPFTLVASSQALMKEMWEAESPDIHAIVETECQN
jgi:hypothetical protein